MPCLLALLGLSLTACGGGEDEVVGIHLTGIDGGFDDGVASGPGDTGADGETGDAGGEGGVPGEDPLSKADPEFGLWCEPQPEMGHYSSCEFKSDCSALDTCFQWEGGSSLCSNHCYDDRDCPGIPGCGAAPSCVRNVCALQCDANGECPEPMTCGVLPALGVRLCM